MVAIALFVITAFLRLVQTQPSGSSAVSPPKLNPSNAQEDIHDASVEIAYRCENGKNTLSIRKKIGS